MMGLPAAQVQSAAASEVTAGRRSAAEANASEDLATLTLDARGMIRFCNLASEMLFKYRRRQLASRHVSILLPELAELELMQNGELNPRLRFLCHIGRRFQAATQNGERFASELFFIALDNSGHDRLSLIVRPAEETVSKG